MRATTLARLERQLRPLATQLPPEKVVAMYSKGRLDFLAMLKDEVPSKVYTPPKELESELWGIKFRSPLGNSSGMFKNGECYEMVEGQGAGAYFGGTGTYNSRTGNDRNGIYLPFTPYPNSHSASNKLALPNDGDEVNSERAGQIVERKTEGCPVFWSVMGSPDYQGEEKLQKLVKSMWLYYNAGVDGIEINESCQNTQHGRPQDDDLANRLMYIKQHFLDHRIRKCPVIVKFSNDTEIEQVPVLLDLLFELGYDGVNFGNTSTQYARRRENIAGKEHKLYDYFTQTFGGGVSGRPLKEDSLHLAAKAVEHTRAGPPPQEFHVTRTGGIESAQDILESEQAGVSFNQWYTGYFDNFAKHGHNVYRRLYERLAA